MSETTETTPEVDSPETPGDRNWREARKALESEREQRRSLEAMVERERQARTEAEAAIAERDERLGDLRAELVFTKAGIDATTPTGRRFFQDYAGELTPDAVEQAYADHLAEARAEAARFATHLARTTTGDTHA